MIPWNLLLQFIIYNFLPNGQGGLGTLDTNDFGVEGPIWFKQLIWTYMTYVVVVSYSPILSLIVHPLALLFLDLDPGLSYLESASNFRNFI